MPTARDWSNFWKYVILDWHQWAVPVGLLAGTLLAGYIVRDVLFRLFRRWNNRTKGHAFEILMNSLRGPIMIWALIAGIYFALEVASLPPKTERFLSKSLLSLWIISLTVMMTHLAGNLIRFYGRGQGGEVPATSLGKTLAQIMVIALGASVLVNHLGFSLTPLLTALGVGGLAVALALQDTLGNLFGGFYVTVAGQVRLGDYIKLNTGEEGYIVDISWRSTTLRMLSNNLIILPNSKLSQAIVTNFYLPEKRMSVSIQVGVSYDSDADRVERILLEIARTGIKEVPGMMDDPEPRVRFNPGFGDSALQFTLWFTVEEFDVQFRVQHEMRKLILKRFREEKIEIPFPTQIVYSRS